MKLLVLGVLIHVMMTKKLYGNVQMTDLFHHEV